MVTLQKTVSGYRRTILALIFPHIRPAIAGHLAREGAERFFLSLIPVPYSLLLGTPIPLFTVKL
jgi:hypothetical protein